MSAEQVAFFIRCTILYTAKNYLPTMSDAAQTARDIRAETALYAILWPHKEAMTSRWTNIVHGTYPFDTIGFLRTGTDRFANPVGYRTEEAAKALMGVVFSTEPDVDVLRPALEEIIRVRAIQDFPPEGAVGVFYALKDIVRDVVRESGRMAEVMPALLAFESRVDAVVLLAFGVYARCRETLHMMKVKEFQRKHAQIFRLAAKKAENTDEADTHNR